MMSFRRLAAGAFAMALLVIPLAALLFLTGCRKQAEIFVDLNLEPDTRLTSAPGPYSQTNYRIHMYWDGIDPDGFVVAYHYAWDDTVPPYGAPTSPWRLTTKSDSLFKALIDSVGETKRHTFYIRAIDNEGKLDTSPARIRFDAWTIAPQIDSLYRVDGPLDPRSDDYDPDRKDTVLMGTPIRFLWGGRDPDGYDPIEDEWAPIQYSYTIDSNPFSPYGDSMGITIPTVASGTHFFYVKGKDETGAENFPENYKFVMNFEPDSHIIEPLELTGTLSVPDGDTIRFRWSARDKEEIEGQGGGLYQIWINLDNDFLKGFTVNTETDDYVREWYFTSNVAQSDSHYIASRNSPQGGNARHLFEIWARDVEGTFERPSEIPEDRETYTFWYNNAPTSEITFPADGDTVCPDFEILWDGVDGDGEIAAYQFVLDPWASAYRVCQVDLPEQACTSWSYEGIEPTGPPPLPEYHEFRVRAQDNANCWEESWNTIRFYVKECE